MTARLRLPLALLAALGLALAGSAAPALAAPDTFALASSREEGAVDLDRYVAASDGGPDAAEVPFIGVLAFALLAAGVTAVGMVRAPRRP